MRCANSLTPLLEIIKLLTEAPLGVAIKRWNGMGWMGKETQGDHRMNEEIQEEIQRVPAVKVLLKAC